MITRNYEGVLNLHKLQKMLTGLKKRIANVTKSFDTF